MLSCTITIKHLLKIGKNIEGDFGQIYYPHTFLGGLKNLHQYNWSPNQNVIPGPPEYEATVTTTRPLLLYNGVSPQS